MTNVWTGVARPSHRQGIIWDGIGRHASMLVCRRLQGIIWDGSYPATLRGLRGKNTFI